MTSLAGESYAPVLGEMFGYYLVALKELAKTCKFTLQTIRDQIIEGLIL